MLPKFASVVARTKDEVLSWLSSLENPRILAGGTDLMVKMRAGQECSHIIDVAGVPELLGLTEKEGKIAIGSAMTHARLSTEDSLIRNARSLALACGLVGSPQIRNMGTIGGNLANASPAADSIPPMLIHDAVLILESRDTQRKVPLEEAIVAPYMTSMDRKELLSSVEITPLRGYREGYRRVAKRATWAISRLGVAFAIREEEGRFLDVKLAIGSCTPMPFRPKKVEDILRGAVRNETIISEAIRMALEEIKFISGIRPSFAYKLPVLKGILEEVLRG
ncbi:MAG: FAD binding domain-containing protein [Syntrophorhabdaceae bacterium]|nr:FAD binding domain-containing protein [Syntrophorhabdaceae bacterium]